MAGKEGMYVANRDVTIRSTFGHTLGFKKGKPMFVPPVMRPEVQKYGVLPVDGEASYQEEVAKAKLPLTGIARVDAIQEAMAKMVLEDDAATNFTATGLPQLERVSELVGFKVDSKERNRVFRKLQEGGALN